VTGYLPLGVETGRLTPAPCRSCAWWQTTGIMRVAPQTASTIRERWLDSVESGWGSPGLVKATHTSQSPTAGPSISAAIHYAPAATLPRLYDLPLAHLPTEAVVLFCLRIDGSETPDAARRLLHEALSRLRQRRVRRLYAFAVTKDGVPHEERCEFFPRSFLAANGFQELSCYDDVSLMRADLRGLLSVLAPFETALRRLLHNDPTPSPAAWSSHESARQTCLKTNKSR
jgi:hypothetical protein